MRPGLRRIDEHTVGILPSAAESTEADHVGGSRRAAMRVTILGATGRTGLELVRGLMKIASRQALLIR